MSTYNVVVRKRDAKHQFRRVIDDAGNMIGMVKHANGKLVDDHNDEYIVEFTNLTASKAKKVAQLGNERNDLIMRASNATALSATQRMNTIFIS